ncbi:MAG: helix-turn-helix domain-containing protein [Pseudomonadota bacterium]
MGAIIEGARTGNRLSQGDLARKLGTTQQTVSRWEAGQSRPRAKQLVALAEALNLDLQTLHDRAHSTSPATVSYDAPFPIDALSPETFERFSVTLIQALYGDAKVHRAGGQGHDQAGIDVTADFPDGKRFTFQCKRHRDFGPQKVHTVVAEDSTTADRKFLLLARTASPDARSAIALHPRWELWDREDISQKVRGLSVEEQKRIVRIYFPGQEQALLGTPAHSPWETTKEFFAAFDLNKRLFNHTWQLVGRQDAVNEVVEALVAGPATIVLLSASAGGGKSRVLKAILEDFSKRSDRTKVRIASATQEITKASLEELGPGQLLLVVDDAHDRDDLQTLFNHVAAADQPIKILVASRPYGVDRIRLQASGYSLSGESLKEINLPDLSLDDATALAHEVLVLRGGPTSMARQIAELTRDCPLATVVGAQVVAEDKLPPLLVQNEARFRSTLLSRFEGVVAGHLADTEDAGAIRKLLGFFALVQPFASDDDTLFAGFEAVEKISQPDTKRITKLLVEAGVLFNRGGRLRISPDVLADHLVESRFQGVGGVSTGLAELYLEELPDGYLENVLVNLGRVDWRLTGQNGGESRLLDQVWSKLNPTEDFSDPHIRAVRAVAFYQPRRALAFVEEWIRKGRFLNQLADIAKYAAYTETYATTAFECLWELGRQDGRDTNPNPSHPIRILTEFAEPRPGKSKEFLAQVLAFGLGLCATPEAWTGKYTPLDFLSGLLLTEGHTDTYDNFTVSMHPYLVDPKLVKPLREPLVDALIAMLSDSVLRKATLAAAALQTALRRPMGLFRNPVGADLIEKWGEEFYETLVKIERHIKNSPIHPVVHIELNRSVNWLAIHGQAQVKPQARKVQKLLSNDLDTRVKKVLIDGYGMEERLRDGDKFEVRWAAYLDQLTVEVGSAYPDPCARMDYIEAQLEEIGRGTSSNPEVLVGRLLEASTVFATAVVERAITEPKKTLSTFSGYALGQVFRADRTAGRKKLTSYLTTGREDLLIASAIAYQAQRYDDSWFTGEDVTNLKALVVSEFPSVVRRALRAVHYIAERKPSLAIDLLRHVKVADAGVADEVAVMFQFGQRLELTMMSDEDVLALLAKFEPLPKLEGHWLDKLIANISELYPWECARFFMRRVEAAPSVPDMRPANHGPWSGERLRIKRSPEASRIMREVAGWMRSGIGRGWQFDYHSRELFECMFGPFDANVVGFLSEWLSTATTEDLRTIASIVRESDPAFVFDQAGFVVALLECARRLGPDVHRHVTGELFASAIGGVKHGSPGQAFPEDLELKARAERMLATLPRFSPAVSLYEDLKQHAEASIRWSLREVDNE